MRTRATALIGREAELAAARVRLADSAGPACFLVGEPGVGKSRLIAEFAARARADGLVVARGRASDIGPVSPLRPFAEALATIHRCGQLPDDSLGGYRPLLARVLPQLRGPGQLGRGEAPPLVAFAEAVLRLLTVLGGQAAGCLLVLEDLHDADPDSLAVLDYLLDNIAGAPIGVLGALRDEPSDTRDLLTAAERRGTAELLPVRPLNQQHTGLLVACCLGIDQASAQLAELAWRNSAGNPLAVEELLHDLIVGGQLCRYGEKWQLSDDAVLAPPPSMLQLIGSRLNRLGTVARRIAVTAAVYGEQFRLATIRVAVQLAEPTFLDAVEVIVADQLIVADGPGRYRFHHPLTHTAVLQLARTAERRQAAWRLADAVLAEDPQQTEATCRLAARLAAEAGKSLVAGKLYAQAGRLALRAGAVEWAAADLSQAVQLRQPDRALPPDLIDDLVSAWADADQLDRALEFVDRLGPATNSDRQRRALTHLDLARDCWIAGRPEQARQQLARAHSLVVGTEARLVRIYCDVMTARLTLGANDAATVQDGERLAHTAAEAAERLAETGLDAAENARAADVACQARWVLAVGTLDPSQTSLCLQRIKALASRYDLTKWALFESFAAINDQWLADGDGLALRGFLDQLQRLGNIKRALMAEGWLCLHLVLTGGSSLASVRARLTDRIEHARRLGNLSMLHSALGTLLLAAGVRADRSATAMVLAQPELTGPPLDLVPDVVVASAICLALEGRDGDALAALEELARRELFGPFFPFFTAFPLGLRLLLSALAGSTSSDEVIAALAGADRIRWTRQFLHWAAAVQAGRRGDPQSAERHAAQAAADAEIFPLARHLSARLVAPAAHADGWGTPIEDLRAAEAWFHEQDVPAAARTCRDLLRTLGAPVRQRRRGLAAVPTALRAAGVTAREYEVGQLVAEHLGNRDIGERLHISPRTVEKHVAALLSKLAVPDRRAIIDRMRA
jgi:DNA-binding CsgD family transcriptional regulator